MGVRVDYANLVKVDDLDTIYITGGGYVRYAFHGISRDSAMGWEEPVWSGELTRSQNFVLSNIDDVEFGLVGRCEISFKYMNVKDYFALCQIAKQRTCVVDYYSRDKGERVTQEMAFTGNELGKLYAFGTKDLGRQDISIKLVATNRDVSGVDLVKGICHIVYNNNEGQGEIVVPEDEQPYWSDSFVLADGTAFTKSGYYLKEFNTQPDGSGWRYLPNQHITVFGDLTLYAIWERGV